MRGDCVEIAHLPRKVGIVVDAPHPLLAQPAALPPRELCGVAELEGRVHANREEAVSLLQRLGEERVARGKLQYRSVPIVSSTDGGDMGEIWGDMGRYREIWGRYGGRYGEMYHLQVWQRADCEQDGLVGA